MEIATIGFTQSSAERFFERLKQAGVRRVMDVRRHNVSQLSGFAKGNDLAYFARAICDASYDHELRLAPTDELLSAYRKDGQTWASYEAGFLQLMRSRGVPGSLDRRSFEEQKTALVCSEATAIKCHRRLVAEMLEQAWAAQVEHL